ncbi:MAG: serine protease [Melioribacteraceae bacterium]
MPRKMLLILLIIAALFFQSCSSMIYDSAYPALKDGKYDSEFPYRSSSEQLEKISNSIKLLNCIVFYKSYIFNESTKLTKYDLDNVDYIDKAVTLIHYNRTASGTATVIYSLNNRVVVLSTAHIIDFPDTLISYFQTPEGKPTNLIESISFKEKQTNYIPDFPEGGELDILAKDSAKDLVLLGKTYISEPFNPPVFSYPFGRADDLEWGSFIYVFGYPLNQKMLTKGIVSNPNRERHTFFVDAIFNKGFSGGIVLAIRDGVPNFELVGLIKSVPGELEFALRPEFKPGEADYSPLIPYQGRVYVDKTQPMRLGVTRVIGAETVVEFINSYKSILNLKGYDEQNNPK